MATFNNGESGLSVRTKINNVLQHTDGTASELVINDAGADVNFRVESDTNANALFVDGGTGNVGIGTSSPAELLHVKGGANGDGLTLQRDSVTTNDYAQLGFLVSTNDAGTPSAWVRGLRGTLANQEFLTLGTSNTERMRITSTGNVGIGTSAPTSTLHVVANGTAITADAGTSAVFQRNLSTGSGNFVSIISGTGGNSILQFGDADDQNDAEIRYDNATRDMRFNTAAAERMRIDSSGNVGIGETAPDYKLDVNGAIGFTPGASVTPVGNGDVVFELTNNTTLTVKAKGSDGVVRSATLTLA